MFSKKQETVFEKRGIQQSNQHSALCAEQDLECDSAVATKLR